jgi:exosortase family protein XrtG
MIAIILLWLFTFLLFKRIKMNFFKFLVGSIGLFTIGMIFLVPLCQNNLDRMIADTLSIIARYTKSFEVYKEVSIASVYTKTGIVSIMIDYECSGIIEMLVFTALFIFFPFGGALRKTLYTVMGNVYIYAANIIRILFIIYITKTFGASVFYLAHTLFARLLFFGLTIVLYYYVFTSTHLKYQKVGEI